MKLEEVWDRYCFAETGIQGIQMKSSPFGRGFLEGWNAALREALILAALNEQEKLIEELKAREVK